MSNEYADPASRERPADTIGLCESCDFVRAQGTKRGAFFYRCGLADEDERFMRYPPLPVRACPGHVKRAGNVVDTD